MADPPARSPSRESPLLIVGWDGVDGRLVRKMIDAGDLPTLATLAARGSWTAIESLPGLGDDAHWSSLATGVGPGRHGRFHYRMPQAGGYLDTLVSREDFPCYPPFWSRIAASGKRVGVLDVPKSPMGRAPGVTEITDWMVHGNDTGRLQCWPAELEDEWRGKWPRDPFDVCHGFPQSADELRAHADELHRRRQLRTRAIGQWLASDRFDTIIAVYAEGHCAGHHFWHLDRPETPAERELAQQLGRPLADMLRALDADLGELIALLPPAARVAVLSPLGMGRNSNADNIVAATLDQLLRQIDAGADAEAMPCNADDDPAGARARSLAFVRAHDSMGTPIRLNVVGREPEGRIPAEHADALRERIRRELLSLRDVGTGLPILDDVLRTDDCHAGERSDSWADLIACWRSEASSRCVEGATLGRFEVETTARRSGNHCLGGWLVADAGLPAPSSSMPVTGLADLLTSWALAPEPGDRALRGVLAPE